VITRIKKQPPVFQLLDSDLLIFPLPSPRRLWGTLYTGAQGTGIVSQQLEANTESGASS